MRIFGDFLEDFWRSFEEFWRNWFIEQKKKIKNFHQAEDIRQLASTRPVGFAAGKKSLFTVL